MPTLVLPPQRDTGRSALATPAGPPAGGWADHTANRALRGAMAEPGNIAKVVAEVVDLHVFFVQWFTDVGPWGGDAAAAEAAFDAFLGRFADSFEYVTTGGKKLNKSMLAGMRGARGGHPKDGGFRIVTVEHDFHPVPHSGGRVVAGTYKEMQQGAVNASDEAHNGTNGRFSTALFEVMGADCPTPCGIRWLRLHECWLSDEETAAFDWESEPAVAALRKAQAPAGVATTDEPSL